MYFDDMNIVWDPKKAESNLQKHGVRFSDAETVLSDPFAMTIEDQDLPTERRFVTVGIDALGRVVVVIYSYRNFQFG